jgi:hypothetical protein
VPCFDDVYLSIVIFFLLSFVYYGYRFACTIVMFFYLFFLILFPQSIQSAEIINEKTTKKMDWDYLCNLKLNQGLAARRPLSSHQSRSNMFLECVPITSAL